jgi:hypothetical protein
LPQGGQKALVELAAGSNEPERLFDLRDVAHGREGGVLRYIGNGKAYRSVLHCERLD